MAGYGVFALIENWDSVINVVIDMRKNKIAFMNTFLINREKICLVFVFSVEHLTV